MACPDTGLRGYECTLTLDGLVVGKARNVTPSFTAAEQDATTRDSGGWDEYDTGRKRLVFSIDSLWVPGDGATQAIEQAFRANEKIAFRMEDAAGYGWSGCAGITQFGPGPRDLDAPVGLTIDCISSGGVFKICGDGSGGSVACPSAYGDWGSEGF